MGLRNGRWGMALSAVAATAAGILLLGPGAAGPGAGPKASFALRSHEPQVVVGDDDASVPLLTPAFKNTGPQSASRGVVLRVSVTNAAIADTAPSHRNCYYSDDYRTAFCEFPDAVPVGAAFETTKPITERINAQYHELEAAYTYAMWPLDSPSPHTPDYKTHYHQGTGDALGLKPTTLNADKRGGELRFRWKALEGPADWAVSPLTIRGRIGEEVEVDVPQPQSTPQPGPIRMRIEPSEVDYCSRDDEDRNIYCTNVNWNVLRVRIDHRADGGEGRISVPEPFNGDTAPANNSAPIKVEITGTEK